MDYCCPIKCVLLPMVILWGSSEWMGQAFVYAFLKWKNFSSTPSRFGGGRKFVSVCLCRSASAPVRLCLRGRASTYPPRCSYIGGKVHAYVHALPAWRSMHLSHPWSGFASLWSEVKRLIFIKYFVSPPINSLLPRDDSKVHKNHGIFTPAR